MDTDGLKCKIDKNLQQHSSKLTRTTQQAQLTLKWEGTMEMKELIREITTALVDNPEQVHITQIDGDRTAVIELRVARTDFGKIIGKKGRTAESIRTILSAASAKQDKRCILEILE
jgi:uncharacterized protein